MKAVKHHGEPLVRISKRGSIAPYKAWSIRGAAVVASLLVCAIVIYMIVEMNPIKVYAAIIEGAFSTTRRAWVTMRDAMTMLCIAVGLAPAFRMRFWNIGAEGQMLVGGIVSAAWMIYFADSLPGVVSLPLMFVLSAAMGGLWGVIPAIFKAKWNTNETLFTLMMNYIAIQVTAFFVALWENPFGSNSVGVINPTTKAGWFPEVFGQMYLLNIIIVMAIAVIMYIYLNYTKHGYEIAVVGESENTARYAAMDVKKIIIRTMIVSGAICGIAGFIAVSGTGHTISTNTAGGRGFTAIIVAWLSKFNTLVMVAFSLLLVILDKGATEIASRYNLSAYVSSMLTGIILFFILASEFFITYKIKLGIGKTKEAK